MTLPPPEQQIRPNDGPQWDFVAHDADVVVYGGEAGGGKTFGLLLDPLRYVSDSGWRGMICRRTFPQVTNPGGLWDEASDLYQRCFPTRLKLNQSAHSIRFPSGATLTFRALQHEKDVYNLQGAQIAWLGYDEGTHFSWRQALYPMTRVRNKHGLPCKIRMTTNPDAESWLAPFLSWWIDQDTGYAVPERSGRVRWLYVVDDQPTFYPTKAAARAAHPAVAAVADPLSVAFIRAGLADTPQLKGSGYEAMIAAQTTVERERLRGNWKITAADGMLKADWFKIVDRPAERYARTVRYWDLAATEPKDRNDPDYTAGVHAGIHADGKTVDVLDVRRERRSPEGVRSLIRATADQDGPNTLICVEEEGGASGKFLTEDLKKNLLRGFAVEAVRPTGDKVVRVAPLAGAVERGEARLVRAAWNAAFISEGVRFPYGSHDDQWDAAAGAYSKLVRGAPREFVGGRP
jgi:predicted phage terminase large subunit-like protein